MSSPRYEYSRSKIQERLSELASLAAPFGLTVRYAMKANPHPEILKMVDAVGVHFDASSSYEADQLLALGIPGERISLSSQQSPHDLPALLSAHVHFTPTSLHQLDQFLSLSDRPEEVGIRINPNIGYGHNNRTSTGGKSASFGIWHEYIPDALAKAERASVRITRLHVHIGSGADPSVWGKVIESALSIVDALPDVTTLNIGGGFKVHRFGDEREADMREIMAEFGRHLDAYKERTGRALRLEIEPGTYLVAHAGTLVAEVDDIVDTGSGGYTFLRLNTGMNDFLRSSLYGAQHVIEVVNDSTESADYVVVGHGCESGDILTPAKGNPEEIEPRTLKMARIGDEVRIQDVGAYGASMRAKGYNGFPEAEEVMVD